MKRPLYPKFSRIASGLALITPLLMQPVSASETKLADLPLANATTVSILPNIYFILDDSGSMGWDYMPDYVTNSYCRGIGSNLVSCEPGDPPYYASSFNRVYYNPMINYTAPINADGSSKTSYTTWTSVPKDGYGIQSTQTINLTTKYPERVACKNISVFQYSHQRRGSLLLHGHCRMVFKPRRLPALRHRRHLPGKKGLRSPLCPVFRLDACRHYSQQDQLSRSQQHDANL
jgi:hypothetical protein